MSTPVQKLFDLTRQDRPRHRRLARPRPADRRGARRGRRQDHADLAQGGRPRGGRGDLQAKGIDARWIAADASDPAQIAAGRRRDDAAPGPHRHPGQQRRRHLGRAGRGLPARGLGQGDEPEHPQPLPVRAGGGQGEHDPAPARPHHQRRVDRRPGRLARHEVHRLRHQQGRGGQLHAHAGRRVGRLRHHRQRAGAGLLPEQDDEGRARRHSAPTSSPRTRRSGASATTTT